jgi:hypothetical protein
MPVKQCQEDGKPGYRWGDSGKCYTYDPGDESSKQAARDKAAKQGQAAYASGYKWAGAFVPDL